jgi:hypothetical protein
MSSKCFALARLASKTFPTVFAHGDAPGLLSNMIPPSAREEVNWLLFKQIAEVHDESRGTCGWHGGGLRQAGGRVDPHADAYSGRPSSAQAVLGQVTAQELE